jgi:hypothetical protein
MKTFTTEYELFRALDDFIYKSKGLDSFLRHQLISTLNNFLKTHKLDTDPHNFVDLKQFKNKE